ncbi:uncharacterized protein NESG_01689 [Nematocida ausubeli]|uniref:Uncharacterized protein n=1 Tax=Nematocida ausubeli (strain ATCC PRA-371 / ERTm2) TaxID=1913371 RepID=A0A086J0P1_NEMA1|nr:uncharacterized protein NESG_01689 [Nematocida ausubeli]KFG25709.1 hypothetical protein NESG_01689 [Nematocida ausubeli]
MSPIAFRIFNVSQKTLLLTRTAMWGFNNKTFLAVACANRLTKHFQVGYLVCNCYCFWLRRFLSCIFSSAFTDAHLLHSTLLYCNMHAWKVYS